MKPSQTKQSSIIKYLLISTFLTLPLFLFLFTLQPGPRRPTTTAGGGGGPTALKPTGGSKSGDLRIRPGYASYESYVQRQLNKTLNPKLRQIWTTRDWERKIKVFAEFFSGLKNQSLVSNESKALCIGARVGQEVEALRRIGVADSVGIDLVPYPPLVVKGDFHHQPFDDATFDFEFSNVFDHALYPERFVSEIERTLKPGGVCVLHVALSRRADKYSANDLYSEEPLVRMFEKSDLVHVRKIDGFGLDTEVVFRKRQ